MEAGRSGEGGQPYLRKEDGRTSRGGTPLVVGDEDFPSAEKQLVLDTDGFLMEAARCHPRFRHVDNRFDKYQDFRAFTSIWRNVGT